VKKGFFQLGLHIAFLCVDFPDAEGLAATKDGSDALFQTTLGLDGQGLVMFREIFPSFAVAQDTIADADAAKHFGGYLAGVGAGGLIRAVLGGGRIVLHTGQFGTGHDEVRERDGKDSLLVVGQLDIPFQDSIK